MACTENPTGSGEDGSCLDYLTSSNSFHYIALWDTIINTPVTPDSLGCDAFMYIGEYIHFDSINGGEWYCEDETLPDLPLDQIFIGHLESNIGSGTCTEISGDIPLVYCQHIIEAREWFWEFRTYRPECGSNQGYYIKRYRNLQRDVYYLVISEEDIPPCPPGATWDRLLGWCEPLPGYKEDPANPGSYIPIYCLYVEKIEDYVHIDGNNTYIYAGKTWTYRIFRSPNEVFDEDENVYISYAGSTITNGIEFIGPNEAIIKSGSIYVDIEVKINIHDNVYGKFLTISSTSTIGGSCGSVTNQILSYNSTPDGPTESPHGTCCEFFDKNYEIWTKTEDDKFYCQDFFYNTPMLY